MKDGECCHEYACQCKPYVQLLAEGLCPPHPVCTERQVLVLTNPADGIENCCPTYECICEAIVECEVCPEGQGSTNRPDRKILVVKWPVRRSLLR